MRFLATIFLLCSLAVKGQQHYPIKNMLGVNIHFWDDDAVFFPAKVPALIDLNPSSIRIYYDADALQDSFGKYGINPTYRGGWTPETSIQLLKQSLPDLFVQVTYHRQTIQIKKDWPVESHLNFPYKYNNPTDRLKPSSYSNMGHDLAVLTLRGGKNAIGQDYPIITNPWPPFNSVVKGGNFYNAIEGGNEWNAWWTINGNLNSNELAAAWVTMYDSVKIVDPSMLFTNGGIASDKPDTFLKAIDWWQKNGYQIPVDYFSYHSYPSAEGQYGWGTFGGLNPEEILHKRAKDMIAAIGSIKPVVIGEWGYDVHKDSPQNAPAFSTYTAEQTRGNWSVRAVLKFAQDGIYMAQWYRAYQDYPNSVYDNFGDQFATMALLRQYDDAVTIIKRTLVGDYFKQLNQFGNYIFSSAIRDDSIQHLKFTSGAKEVQSLWSVETYTIVNNRPVFAERKIPYTLPKGTIYRLNEDSSGVMTSEAFSGGAITLTSKPFFFVADPVQSPLPIKLISFTAQKVNQAAVLKWIVEDADKIEVERSTDGRTWINLGEGIFNKLVDMHPSSGKNYYRLKMYEGEGFSYSPIRTVDFKKQIRTVYVIDALGRVVQEEKTDKDLVEMEHQLKLARGVYLLRSENETRKFIKQ